jgi:hypothetical protein
MLHDFQMSVLPSGQFLSLEVNNGPVSLDQEIASLARMIANRMLDYETLYKQTHKPIVISLCCHWFLSLLALVECAARIVVNIFLAIAIMYLLIATGFLFMILFLVFSIVTCFSCGKFDPPVIGQPLDVWQPLIKYQEEACGLYKEFFCGIIGNISNIIFLKD